jgi:hypothetical protein
MSFRDCISSAVATGRVSEAKGDTAKAAYDAAIAKHIAAGLSAGDAALQAAKEATEAITKTTRERRWQKVNEIQRAHEIHTALKNADDPSAAIDQLMRDLELSYESVMGYAMANLDEFLVEYAPTVAGLRRPTAGLEDIPRAAYGQVTDAAAVKKANAIQQTMESLRLLANRYGANIPDNPNNRMFQTHDAVRVAAVSEDKWVGDHMAEGVLDWGLMQYRGEKIEPGAREEILRRVYRGIISDGYDDVATAQTQGVTLANRLNRDRFLYYASGDAWNAMQKAYGAGNVHQQIIGMIDAMAKDISLLMKFGPNPEAMKAFTKKEALAKGAELDANAGANKRAELNKVRRRLAVMDDEYNIHARHVPTLEGNWAVQAWTTLPKLAVNALLGSIFIPSFISDSFNARAVNNLFNMPTAKAFREYFSELRTTPEAKQEAINAGVIFEHGISIATNRIRYLGIMDGPAWIRNVGEFTYRAGLTSMHTQVARNAAGKSFQSVLYGARNTDFDDLPFAPFLVENGVTKADWDAMRTTPVYEWNGAKVLRPVDLWRSGNNEAGLRFSNAMQQYIRSRVVDPSLRTRAAMGEAIDPNTVKGQAWRTVTSLTSFPIEFFFNHMRRIAAADNKMELMAKYFAWMTVGGMFITNTKAVVNGQNPYLGFDEEGNFNPATARGLDFLGRSVVNGGSLGILGDTLFNTINIANSGYRPGNPTEEYIESLLKLTLGNAQQAAAGDETKIAADVYDFADKNVPDFWQTKLLVRRYITDEWLREADPAAWERKKKYEVEHAEGSWWGMGDDPEL